MVDDYSGAALLVGLLLVFTFFFTDCAAGDVRSRPATVTSKWYKPPWTSMSCDTNGCTTTRHPEQFWVGVSTNGELTEVSTTRAVYALTHEGDQVKVNFRVGRWTHWEYVHAIKLSPERSW